MIWRTESRLVDKVILLDHPLRFVSRVIRWYDLIHSSWYSTLDQVTIIMMCIKHHNLINQTVVGSLWIWLCIINPHLIEPGHQCLHHLSWCQSSVKLLFSFSCWLASFTIKLSYSESMVFNNQEAIKHIGSKRTNLDVPNFYDFSPLIYHIGYTKTGLLYTRMTFYHVICSKKTSLGL